MVSWSWRGSRVGKARGGGCGLPSPLFFLALRHPPFFFAFPHFKYATLFLHFPVLASPSTLPLARVVGAAALRCASRVSERCSTSCTLLPSHQELGGGCSTRCRPSSAFIVLSIEGMRRCWVWSARRRSRVWTAPGRASPLFFLSFPSTRFNLPSLLPPSGSRVRVNRARDRDSSRVPLPPSSLLPFLFFSFYLLPSS